MLANLMELSKITPDLDGHP